MQARVPALRLSIKTRSFSYPQCFPFLPATHAGVMEIQRINCSTKPVIFARSSPDGTRESPYRCETT